MYYKNERDMKLVKDIDKTASKKAEVTDKQAEEAFKLILTWIGENPNREGLLETPKRVVKAFKEYFKGYHQDANSDLLKLSIYIGFKSTFIFLLLINFFFIVFIRI